MRWIALFLAGTVAGCAPETTVETPSPPPGSIAEGPRRDPLPASLDVEAEEYVAQWGRHWPSFRLQGVVAIVDEGEPAYLRAHGYRDLARRVEHDPQSRFSLGTLSAHLTAAAVMRLSEAEVLDLTAPVSTYLPDFAPGDRITIEQLLTHTSGLPSFTDPTVADPDGLGWSRLRGDDHQELVARISSHRLQFEPGSDFAPSNSNYAVLGRVIEVVGRQPYADTVREQVLEPLGMEDTRFGDVDAMHAIGLRFEESGEAGARLEPVTGISPRAGGAALGWISTATDLGKLYHGLGDDGFVSARSRERMLGQNPLGTPYALVSTTFADRSAYVWKGLFEGHDSAVLWIPAEDRVFIALGNSEVVPGDAITTNLANLAYGLEKEKREEPAVRAADGGDIERLVGQWRLTPKEERRLGDALDPDVFEQLSMMSVDLDHHHALLRMGPTARRFYPMGGSHYFFKDHAQSRADFIRGHNSSGDRVVLIRDGVRITYERSPTKLARRG